MILEIFFLLFMVIYWFSEGCTEGYTWAKPNRRSKNKLIFGSINKKGNKNGEGVLDYNAWRLGENIGTVGCILTAFTIGSTGGSYIGLGLVWLGSWMVGYFVYERALNYVCSGDAFVKKGAYHMMNITIPRSNAFDWGVCVVGLIIFILGC